MAVQTKELLHSPPSLAKQIHVAYLPRVERLQQILNIGLKKELKIVYPIQFKDHSK